MRQLCLGSIFCVTLAWAGAACADDQDLNQLLLGDYAYTGTDNCLVSLTGFTADLIAKAPSFVVSNNIEGVVTFNGDGTGARRGTTIAFAYPPNATPAAALTEFEVPFTYQVAPDHTYVIQSSAPLTGSYLAGTRAGQTFTLDNVTLTGRIGRDGNSATLATKQPNVEVFVTLAGGVPILTQFRLCHRSNVLLRLQADQE